MEAIDRLRTMIGNVYRYEGVGRMTVHDVIESESFGILKTDTGGHKNIPSGYRSGAGIFCASQH